MPYEDMSEKWIEEQCEVLYLLEEGKEEEAKRKLAEIMVTYKDAPGILVRKPNKFGWGFERLVDEEKAREIISELTKRGYKVKGMRTESGDCLYSYHQFLIQTPSGGEVRIAGSLVWFENVKREELYELRGFIKEIFSQGKFV